MVLKAMQDLKGHIDKIWTLSWNPQGNILASSGSDKVIRLWCQQGQTQTWTCKAMLVGSHTKTIRFLSWSPCGTYLASASFDSLVLIWKRDPHLDNYVTVGSLEGHESEVKCVAWSYDGKYLASCGRDKSVWIWERAPGDDEDQDSWDCSDVKNDHTKDVKHLTFHPNSHILASCGYDDTIRIYLKTPEEWSCIQTIDSHQSTVWSVDFSASGEHLVSCSDDKTVRIWTNTTHKELPNLQPKSWKCSCVLQGYHSRVIYDITWCKLTNVIASVSGDNSIVVYKPEVNDSADSFVCKHKFYQAHNSDINSVKWNPQIPGLLASAGDDGTVKLWTLSDDDLSESTEKCKESLKVFDYLLKNLTIDEKTLDGSYKLTINDYSNLQKSTQILQELKSEATDNNEILEASKIFGLDLQTTNSEWLHMIDLKFDEHGLIEQFSVVLRSDLKFVISVSKDFGLMLPRRISDLTCVANDMFLTEKTGDLYKINMDGTCTFLMGHLFSFTDVCFMLSRTDDMQKETIKYIISSDRDEKIRVSNYPNVYSIETFCFGHESHVKKLVVMEGQKFVSIDQNNNFMLWYVCSDNVKSQDSYLSPLSTWRQESQKILEKAEKRIKLEKD